jgi:hypothetical protein
MDKGLLYVEKLKKKKEIERRDKRNARKRSYKSSHGDTRS